MSPLMVALTGNIASGKSAVAATLADMGAAVIDADILARKAVEKDSKGYHAVVRRFGTGILNADSSLNRGALRKIVFSDPDARDALNSIVHPIVGRLRESAISQAEEAGNKVIISVIPLLFETGLDREFDRILLVDAPAETRLNRIVNNRGLSASEASAMIAAQMPATQKRVMATWIIDNDGTIDELREKTLALWPQMLDVASQGTSFHGNNGQAPGHNIDQQSRDG